MNYGELLKKYSESDIVDSAELLVSLGYADDLSHRNLREDYYEIRDDLELEELTPRDYRILVIYANRLVLRFM